MFIGYMVFSKRETRIYYLPDGYEGWVTIRFEKIDAPPFKEVDGGVMLEIDSNGIAETSDKLEMLSWGRDVFYLGKGENAKELPTQILEDGVFKSQIHKITRAHMRFDSLLVLLPAEVDTVLFEDSEIEIADGKANISKGHPVLLHFYVTSKPETAGFQPPKLPERREFWESWFLGE